MEEVNLFNLESTVIDLGGNSGSSGSSSVNFGPGIELLMNDKRTGSNNINIDLGELDNLEKELNEMTGNYGGGGGGGGSNNQSSTTRSFGFSSFGNLFGGGGGNENVESVDEVKMNFGGGSDGDGGGAKIGSATRQTHSAASTWDGFTKYNEIPAEYKSSSSVPDSSKMNEREKRRKKKMMIKKLEEWREKGLIKNYSHFGDDSPYEEVEDEYESALEDKRKKDSIKLQGWWFMTFVNSVEYANAAFNPFDINLDGWGEQVNEDIDSYEEIFSELHEKYKGGKLSPELSLLLRLGFSAAVVNFTNKALSTATPGFNDVIKQSPELMKLFTNATVSSMSQQSPGFAFASNLVNNPEQINSSFGPPPPPMETNIRNTPSQHLQPSNVRQPMSQMNYTPAAGRQDIDMARGSMFREQGVDIGGSARFGNPAENYSSINTPAPEPQPRSAVVQNASNYQQSPQQPQQPRVEMRGPQDLDNILSGLKTKSASPQQQQQQQYSSPILETIDMALSSPPQQQQQPQQQIFGGNLQEYNIEEQQQEPPQQQKMYSSKSEDNSMISISSLKYLQNETIPLKRGRKPKNGSSRNIIALDI